SGAGFRPEAGVAGTDFIPLGAQRPDAATLDALNASIPGQGLRVAALFLGDVLGKQPGAPAVPAGIADALDAAREVGLATGAPISVAQGSHPALHPGRTAELSVAGRVVGVAGELL
ncbi:hypothetical protein, partial [Mesorhizobium japonicum]|uniref:hypothetical protein n=1 Tax=Mesorhizobium japonicum TaxID=2066070 RepID=UPI003B5BF86F